MSVHKRYYAAAAEEVASNIMDQALWIKAMVQAGNEQDARRLYLHLRAEELAREGVREQAKDLWKRGVQAWIGQAPPALPERKGTNPWALVGALALCGLAAYFIYQDVPRDKTSQAARWQAATGPTIPVSKYLWRDVHTMDFDGITFGDEPIKIEQHWPGVQCKVTPNYAKVCESTNQVGLLAGIRLQGDALMLINQSGSIQMVSFMLKDTVVDDLRGQYDALWGPGRWVNTSQQTGAAGWIWKRGGMMLKVNAGPSPAAASATLWREK